MHGSTRLTMVLVVPVILTVALLAGLGAVAQRSQP